MVFHKKKYFYGFIHEFFSLLNDKIIFFHPPIHLSIIFSLHLELPWDQPTLSCKEYLFWKENNYTSVTPWSKLDTLTLSFLRKILVPNPEKRFTLDKIQQHKWCQTQLSTTGKLSSFLCRAWTHKRMYVSVLFVRKERKIFDLWKKRENFFASSPYIKQHLSITYLFSPPIILYPHNPWALGFSQNSDDSKNKFSPSPRRAR